MTHWRWLAAVAVAALVLVLALGFRRDPRDVRSGTVGRPAPAFELARLDGGGTLAFRDLAGQAVVVNFFASWCRPCKEEHPVLLRAWERYRTSGVVIVGILYQDDEAAGLDFMRRLGGTWPTVRDEGGRTALAYGVFGIPETFFIGTDGIIAGRHVGPLDDAVLTAAIEAIRPKAPR